MTKKEQIELSKKLYKELSGDGFVKKHKGIGYIIWKIAFGTACNYIVEQLKSTSVSNQRELLITFLNWHDTTLGVKADKKSNTMFIDEFLNR